MTERESTHEPSRRPWIFLALFMASLFPLLLLNLDDASQLASALALPLAVLLAALPAVPQIRGRSGRPLQWRRYLVMGAIVVALLGLSGVMYAIWQNTKDIPVYFPSDGGSGEPWRDGSYTHLSIPGEPPERGHLTLVVSLTNVARTGDCEQTATLEFTPILDSRHLDSVFAQPEQEASLSLIGAVREARVKVTLHYEPGNRNCAVDLHIDEAVLHD